MPPKITKSAHFPNVHRTLGTVCSGSFRSRRENLCRKRDAKSGRLATIATHQGLGIATPHRSAHRVSMGCGGDCNTCP